MFMIIQKDASCPMPDMSSRLSELSLGSLQTLFETLHPPSFALCHGNFRADFIGPAWLRMTAPPAIAASGLRGWRGKCFLEAGQAVNRVMRGGREEQVLPMTAAIRPSLRDDTPVLALTYGASSPLPWRFVCDEVRQLDEDHLLAMTVIDLPGLRRLGVPFLLTRVRP